MSLLCLWRPALAPTSLVALHWAVYRPSKGLICSMSSSRSEFVTSAYGLRVFSDLDLPDLRQATGDGRGDIRILERPLKGGAGLRSIGHVMRAGPNTIELNLPDIGTFGIYDGQTIHYTRVPGVSDRDFRQYLMGSGLGALLIQRGTLVLHGTAIDMDGTCIVCVGHSGAGKSTLAAAMLKDGHDVLSDDVSPITADTHVLPGLPRIKLTEGAARHLGLDPATLTQFGPSIEKYAHPTATSMADHPRPVSAIFALEPDDVDHVSIKEVQGFAKVAMLRDHTYRLPFVEGMSRHEQHFHHIVALARCTPVHVVRRPQKTFALSEFVEALKTRVSEIGKGL